MKLTQFTFYKNTPLTDANNTIHFKDNQKRDDFFNRHYEQKTTAKNYNFMREGLILEVNTKIDGITWQWLQNVNYLRFTSDFEYGAYYYCYVPRVEYVNEGVTRLYLIVDGVMTFLQGDFTVHMNNINVQRQHLIKDTKTALMPYLRTNSDVINVGQKYISNQQAGYYFTDFVVILRSAVKLHDTDFGDEDNPRVRGASGGQYDGVVGAQNLYAVAYDQFTDFMSTFRDYPWATENITKVEIIPTELVNLDSEHATRYTWGGDGAGFWYLKKSSGNVLNNADDKLYVDKTKLYDIFNVNPRHPETFRQEYASITMTGYNGQAINLNPALLDNDTLKIRTDSSVGFQNEIRFYPYKYGMTSAEYPGQNLGEKAGSYMDNAIIFKNFDTVPVVIDRARLAVASSANARRVGNEKTLRGAMEAQSNPNNSASDKFMIGASQTARWISGVGSSLAKGNVLGAVSAGANMINDDYWHYRQQNAQIQDQAITPASLTEQTTNNAFNIKHDIFGLTVKYQIIAPRIMEAVDRYHERFGYQMDFVTRPDSIESMGKLNYLRCSGVFRIAGSFPDIPTPIFKQIEAQLETGISFWHNPNDLDNPFLEDVMPNLQIK